MIVEILLFSVLLLLFLSRKGKNNGKLYPPGPTGLPIVGMIPFLGEFPQKKITEYGKKYGKIFSLKLGSFEVVVLNDFELIKNCFKQEVFSGRPKDKMLMLSILPRGIVYNEGPEAHDQRRFALKNLRDFGWGKQTMNALIMEDLEGIIDYFKTNVGKPIDIKPTLNIAFGNSIIHICTGEKNSLDDARAIEMNRIGQTGFLEPAVAGTVYFLPWLAKIFPKWSQLDAAMYGMHYFEDKFKKVFQEHKETFDPNNLRDFTDTYLKEMENTTDKNSSFYGETGYINFVQSLIAIFVAASDTTSTTICWAIIYFIHYPETMKKLQKEIDTVIGHSRFATSADRPNLPYTEACMWEVMRLSSIVPHAQLHSTLEDVELEGFNIPKRTIIMPNLHNVHHDPEYWGDPEVFRPERFLGPSGEFKKNERVIPFSIGKRVCIAESLAQNSVFMFLCGLVQNFDFVKAPGEPLPKLDGKYGLVTSPYPFKVQIQLRN